eukprot:CAMPEP_0194482214 /NCGR_PEP_ID=MMETSP0253-20130528/4270_1 /TAXON_ID=2966 /ORGANISM="Noctiluca scintillans" /LENGTH=209 /DNA_ID=CAMNT_0039321739 /DNA_START=58 /DNA_END=687 /DNA_ORIENTATION=+
MISGAADQLPVLEDEKPQETEWSFNAMAQMILHPFGHSQGDTIKAASLEVTHDYRAEWSQVGTGQYCGEMYTREDFEVSMELRLTSPIQEWGSIFKFQAKSYWWDDTTSLPSLWQGTGAKKPVLEIVTVDTEEFAHHDPTALDSLDWWEEVTVALRVESGDISMFAGDKRVFYKPAGPNWEPELVTLHVGDSVYPPASAEVRNLRHKRL